MKYYECMNCGKKIMKMTPYKEDECPESGFGHIFKLKESEDD